MTTPRPGNSQAETGVHRLAKFGAVGADDRVGRCEPALDDGGKPPAVVDDLDEAEGASDIDDSPERIISVRLPQLHGEASRLQGLCGTAERLEIGDDADSEILGEAHIAVGRQGDCSDRATAPITIAPTPCDWTRSISSCRDAA